MLTVESGNRMARSVAVMAALMATCCSRTPGPGQPANLDAAAAQLRGAAIVYTYVPGVEQPDGPDRTEVALAPPAAPETVNEDSSLAADHPVPAAEIPAEDPEQQGADQESVEVPPEKAPEESSAATASSDDETEGVAPAGDEAPVADRGVSAEDLEALMAELQALQERVDRIEQNTDSLMNTAVTKLGAENEMLLQEIQRMVARLSNPAGGGATQGEGTPSAEGSSERTGIQSITGLATTAGAVRYTIVKEWGRSPEEAARAGPTVESLKGMVCAVRSSIPEESLIAMGRTLRARYRDYDNVKIEVFDDPGAARRYVNENAPPGENRLLVVSKQSANDQDAVVIFRKGVPEELPLE